MSLINGSLPERNKNTSKSNSSRITAPNGSIISRSSGSKETGSKISNKKVSSNVYESTASNSKRGSVVSNTQSEKIHFQSNKCGSVVSGVSSQVVRRKLKRDLDASNTSQLTSRSMSANSLGRRSNENLYQNLKKQPKSQSVMSLAVAEEVQMLGQEERKLILAAIKRCKQNQRLEDRRKQTLKTKINEIKAMRPPFPSGDTKVCYICYGKFWPLFSSKVICCRCKIFVCKKCVKEYKIGNICSSCALEILYTAQIGSIFTRDSCGDENFDDIFDISTLERMITKTSVDQQQNAEILKIPNDRVDALSVKSKSGSSIGEKFSLQTLLRRKKNTSIASYSQSVKENGTLDDDQKSIQSMAISNSKTDVSVDEIYPLISGEIMIGVSYNYTKKELKIIIKKCRDLQMALKKENTSNPYVKIRLLPHLDGEPVCKTKVIYNELNPIFNEECKFRNMKFEEFSPRTLMVTVLHCEHLGKDVFLGQKLIELSSQSFENATASWYKLEDKRPDVIPPTLSKYYGDINFSLKYSSTSEPNIQEVASVSINSQNLSTGCLKILIQNANNLFSSKYNKLPNSYVKCLMLPDSKNNIKKKTHIIQKNFNPIWEVEFSFPYISRRDLLTSGLEITVWDKKLGFIPDVLMGGVSLNISRGNKPINKIEAEVWQKMIEKPETWIKAKLILRKDLR